MFEAIKTKQKPPKTTTLVCWSSSLVSVVPEDDKNVQQSMTADRQQVQQLQMEP